MERFSVIIPIIAVSILFLLSIYSVTQYKSADDNTLFSFHVTTCDNRIFNVIVNYKHINRHRLPSSTFNVINKSLVSDRELCDRVLIMDDFALSQYIWSFVNDTLITKYQNDIIIHDIDVTRRGFKL